MILFYVVLFPGLISFIFWIKGVSIIGANRAGVFLAYDAHIKCNYGYDYF